MPKKRERKATALQCKWRKGKEKGPGQKRDRQCDRMLGVHILGPEKRYGEGQEHVTGSKNTAK